MASWNKNWSTIGCAYFGDTCLVCGGPHLWKHCHNIFGNGLCAPTQSFKRNVCSICGGHDGHWNDCPKYYSPSPSPYYDSLVVCDVNRSNEVEDAESLARLTDMMKKIVEQDTLIREQNAELEKTMERIRAKLTEMQVESETYNLQVTGLANTQDEPQTEEESEFIQGDNFEKAKIVSQSWLTEQAQEMKFHGFLRDGLTNMATQLIEGRTELRQDIDKFDSDIHDLQALMNKKVEMSDAQPLVVMDTGLHVEQEEEFQPFDQNIVDDANVEGVHMSEDVQNKAVSELGHVGPHSKHFSTLCFVGDMKIEPSKLLEKCINKEQEPYILKFATPKGQNSIRHLRAKKCKMRHLLLGSFIFTPPPQERSRKFDAKLGAQFISSKWREKW